MEKIKIWLAPPRFDSLEKTNQAFVLNILLLASLLGVTLFMTAVLVLAPGQHDRIPLAIWLVPIILITRSIMKQGYVRQASLLFILGLWLVMIIGALTAGGVATGSFSGFILIVVLAGLLISYRTAVLFIIINSLLGLFFVLANDTLIASWKISTLSPTSLWLAHISYYIVIIATAYLYTSRVNLALQHAQEELQERQRSESALRASEERYRNLVESAHDIVFTLDNHAMLTSLNPAFEFITGWARQDWLGKPLQPLVHANELPLALEKFNELRYNHSAVAQMEILIRTAHNDYRLFELSATPQIKDSEFMGVLGIARDITERKQTEKLLRQAQKLDSLGLLAGGVAHDFNNLLVAMLGQTSLALNKLPNGHPAREAIQKAANAAQRGADLTRQLLAYSGHSQFEVLPINLNHLIEENLHLLSVAVPKDVFLQTALMPSLPFIEADTGQMQQVIMNLIINAVQAIGNEPGTITISTGIKQISPSDTQYWQRTGRPLAVGKYVSLQVHDTGIGIDADTQARIFEPFFTTKQQGHGLGLAAVLGIVRGHFGGIRVYSETGRGTLFRLLFPLSESLPKLENKSMTKHSSMEKGVVLIIDDEILVLEAVSDILTSAGFKILTASSGQEGIALFKVHCEKIKLVLLDLSMPDMDGVETFSALKKVDPEIRVILSSGYHQEEATRQFLGQGLTGFLQKPYSFDTLTAKIQEYMES